MEGERGPNTATDRPAWDTTCLLLRVTTSVVLGAALVLLVAAWVMYSHAGWVLEERRSVSVGMAGSEVIAQRGAPDGVASADDAPTWKSGFEASTRPVEGLVFWWVVEGPALSAFKVYMYVDERGIVTCAFVGGTQMPECCKVSVRAGETRVSLDFELPQRAVGRTGHSRAVQLAPPPPSPPRTRTRQEHGEGARGADLFGGFLVLGWGIGALAMLVGIVWLIRSGRRRG